VVSFAAGCVAPLFTHAVWLFGLGALLGSPLAIASTLVRIGSSYDNADRAAKRIVDDFLTTDWSVPEVAESVAAASSTVAIDQASERISSERQDMSLTATENDLLVAQLAGVIREQLNRQARQDMRWQWIFLLVGVIAGIATQMIF
jgi:hypothetical protein